MDEMEFLPDRIFDNYLNTTILITGGTGFLGKVIIERLLRVFDVKRIYILIRDKSGKTPSTRLQEIFSNPLYDKLRNLKGERIFEKCQPISGDISRDCLGLLPKDRDILEEEVEYVINTAASIKFDDPLKKALLINAKGTLSMVEFAKRINKLKLFIHVSTAYSHPEWKVVEEKIYPIKYNYEKIIPLSEYFDEDTLEVMRKSFMKDVPNTYTVSKAIGEDIVAKAMDSLPIIIMRPTIGKAAPFYDEVSLKNSTNPVLVISSWKEPIPGWTDNLNGPVGAIIAFGTGVLRSMYARSDMHADLVCVDYVADSVLVLGAYSLQNQFPNKVFNISSHNQISLTWKQAIDLSIKVNKEKIPFDIFLWVPNGVTRNTRLMYYIDLVLWHFIPALIIDMILPLFGHKPMLWKVQMRVMKAMGVLEFYTNNEWTFHNHCFAKARAWLNAKELGKYILTQSEIVPEKFATNQVLGLRRYILKEPDENIPKSRRFMRIMVWVDKILSVVFKLFLAYIFYRFVVSKIYNWL